MITRPVTRRDFSMRLAAMLPALGLARLPFASAASAAPPVLQDDGISHDAEAIHQEVAFKASPMLIYDALMDAKQFSKMTGGAPAEIDRKAGGAFSLFGARIKGRSVFLLRPHLIVQAWRSEAWEPGAYSIVHFDLKAQGTGTKLVFDHTGFPKGEAQHLATGWKLNYWDSLEKFLT